MDRDAVARRRIALAPGVANSSSRIGSKTTPATPSQATLTHHSGKPNRKLIVPSSGSTIQRTPGRPGVSSPSSPMIASSGRRAPRMPRIVASAARSASDTRSVGSTSGRRTRRPRRSARAAARPRPAQPPRQCPATLRAHVTRQAGAGRPRAGRLRSARRATSASPRRSRGPRAGRRSAGRCCRSRGDGCRRLAGYVEDRLERNALRAAELSVNSAPRPSYWPIRDGPVAVPGVIRTSTSSKIWLIRAAFSASPARPFAIGSSGTRAPRRATRACASPAARDAAWSPRRRGSREGNGAMNCRHGRSPGSPDRAR